MQLVYIDHRGQGRSARGPRETYTLENDVEDLEALRDYLGLDKIVLLGASYGGMVALSYAVRYPQNVSHLLAIVTVPARRVPRSRQGNPRGARHGRTKGRGRKAVGRELCGR